MSLPNSADPNQATTAAAAQTQALTRPQGVNVYTVMLIVSFVALLIACLLLFLELRRWGSFPYWSVPTGPAMILPGAPGFPFSPPGA